MGKNGKKNTKMAISFKEKCRFFSNMQQTKATDIPRDKTNPPPQKKKTNFTQQFH
jgi:hypothetical protein